MKEKAATLSSILLSIDGENKSGPSKYVQPAV
jgi:hypothetical protein